MTISYVLYFLRAKVEKFYQLSFLFLFLRFKVQTLSSSVYLLDFMRRRFAPSVLGAATATASTPRPCRACVTRATTARWGQTPPHLTQATRARPAPAPPATTVVVAPSLRLPAPWGLTAMRPR